MATPTKSSDDRAFWFDDYVTEELGQMLALWSEEPAPTERLPTPVFLTASETREPARQADR